MAWAKGCNHEHSTNRQGDYNELNAWGNRPFTQAVMDEWYAGVLLAQDCSVEGRLFCSCFWCHQRHANIAVLLIH
jgi:hypothetical protein